MHEGGSVPGTCGRDGRDETMVPKRRMWLGEGKNLSRPASSDSDLID